MTRTALKDTFVVAAIAVAELPYYFMHLVAGIALQLALVCVMRVNIFTTNRGDVVFGQLNESRVTRVTCKAEFHRELALLQFSGIGVGPLMYLL